MNLLRTLLVATDLSAASRQAAMRAAVLANQCKARLVLQHVLEKSALLELQALFDKDAGQLQERIRSHAQEALAQLSADIVASQKVSPTTQLHEGLVLDDILSQAELLDASLLVVGARGTNFMRSSLLGTTAERLLRKTQRPVLVVKQAPHGGYRHVLVPLDFSSWSEHAIRLAQAVAPDAQLVLLHVCETPFEGKMRFAGIGRELIQRHHDLAQHEAMKRMQQIEKAIPANASPALSMILHGDAAYQILEQEEEQGTDLIVLGKHGAGMAEELLLGSVTKHVLMQSRCDVLVTNR